MVNNELFNAAVKALKVCEKMNEPEYIKVKEHILAECADLGEEAQAFIKEFFILANERRTHKAIPKKDHLSEFKVLCRENTVKAI